MKRKVICMYIFCAIIFLFPLQTYAADTANYVLDELGMNVSLPSNYVVFTRDINAADPNLSAYGLTKDNMLSLMTSKNIYLNAWNKGVDHEIIITMIKSTLVDFNQYSDATLLAMAQLSDSEYDALGITYIKSEVYRHKQAKFLKIYTSQPNGDSTVYGLQYYTVYDDKAINITMQSYSGQITSSNEAIQENIVDSVVFNTPPQVTETKSAPTAAFIYTDTKTQTAFTVPENWVEEPLSEQREYFDVKFTSNEDEGMIITYGSFDLWESLSASEKAGHSRADVNNSIYTKEDLAEMYGIAVSEVGTVTYDGYQYYKAEVTTINSLYGADIAVTMTQFFRVDNGYIYSFQFSGTSDNALFADFESLLDSVSYPKSGSDSIVIPTSRQYNKVNINSMDITGPLFLSLLITIAIYSLPIIIYRFAIRRSPVGPNLAKKITIIYGVLAFIIMSILIYAGGGQISDGGAILMWSFINYIMLVSGKKKEKSVVE